MKRHFLYKWCSEFLKSVMSKERSDGTQFSCSIDV